MGDVWADSRAADPCQYGLPGDGLIVALTRAVQAQASGESGDFAGIMSLA